MYRLVEASRFLRDVAPAVVPLYLAVTALGGATFLTVALALAYWGSRRRRETALVVSYVFVALGVTLAVKAALGFERPPAELHLVAAYDDPYGFPSGHAIVAVVVYGGLVATVDRLRTRRGAAAAAVLAGAVALSRVVLGVHYLGDALAGLLLGVALLAALRPLAAGDPTRGFALAAVAALPAVAVAGPTSEAAVALGGSLGGLLGSRRVDAGPPAPSPRRRIALVCAGLAFLAVGRTVEEAAGGDPGAVLAANAALVAGVLLLPAALGRLSSATDGRADRDGTAG